MKCGGPWRKAFWDRVEMALFGSNQVIGVGIAKQTTKVFLEPVVCQIRKVGGSSRYTLWRRSLCNLLSGKLINEATH